MRSHPLTRRALLIHTGQLAGLAAVALLAACGGSAATTGSASTVAAPSTSAATTTASAAPSTAVTTSSAAVTSSAVSTATSSSAATSTQAAASTTAAATASTTSAPTSAPTTAATTSAVQSAGQTLRFMWVDTGQQVWRDAWKTMLDGFTKSSGVTVDPDPVDFGKASEKALTVLAGGGYYDYLYGYFGWLSGWVSKQVIQPLDPFLAKDKSLAAGDFYPAATEHFQGKLYGLAWFTNGKEIWYNADLFKAAGQPTPREQEQAGNWTWQALLESAQKLTKSDGGKTTVYGFTGSFYYLPDYVMPMWAWGAAPYSADFSKATFDTTPQTTALQFTSDMVNKQKVAEGGDFTKSTLAMILTGSFEARTVQEQILPKNPFTVEMAPLPKGPTGERPVALANNCNYLCAAAKMPEQAWALNTYLLSAAAQPQIAQLGGGRYVANKNVKPVVLYPYEDLQVYQQSAARSRAMPLILKETEIEKSWTDDWKSLTTGKMDVNGMLANMQQQATIDLQQGGCVC